MNKEILLVDDNEEIIDLLIPHLVKEGFMPVIARDGEEAEKLFYEKKPLIVLLDIMMPKKDGITVCKEIRKNSKTPIIMITAKSEDEDVIMGLDVGADDYIVKPFSPKQVVAKVKAILRRLDISNDNDKVLNVENLNINMDEYTIRIDGEIVELTKKEIEILYLLAKHPSMVYSRETLLNTLWGYEYYGDARNVDTHIKRLRAKLGLNDKKFTWDIKTVWGVGYKFEIEEK
ncbi:MAG: response regulator transcription factor [Clostridia bacterium]